MIQVLENRFFVAIALLLFSTNFSAKAEALLADSNLLSIDALETKLRAQLSEDEQLEIRFNLFTSLVRLNRMQEADALYREIAEEILVQDIDQTRFSNLLVWALIQESDEVWQELRPKLEQALTENHHEISFQPGDPSRLLFHAYEEDWQSLGIEDEGNQRWMAVKQLWPAYFVNKDRVRELMQLELNTLQTIQFEPKTMNDQSHPWWEVWGLPALGFVLMLTGLFFFTRKISAVEERRSTMRQSASSVELLNQLERIVEEYLTDEEGKTNPSAVAKNELNVIIEDLKSGRIDLMRAQISQRLPEGLNLNRIEREALALFVLGYSGKQAAVVLDRSQGYIYNMRHRVRIKLDMDKDQTFDAWFNELKAAKA